MAFSHPILFWQVFSFCQFFLVLTFHPVRILGAILLIVEEETKDPSVTLITVTYIFQSIGLSPLIQATIGFLNTV